ncbi:hypothetical protein SELMODRAFT_408264 [Selaginella moellendorffii]|uniref:Protein kinase domain-containing protein n=1 Tax=Selaginella moellendorffii TaxID=88036 RepID=D8R7R3_SELML|nr:hypothetical protein SELMODRAFT_408264 [Selaginella moellendorffii]
MAKLRGCPGVVSFRDFIKERDGGQCFGNDPEEMLQYCGTAKYMAPEVAENKDGSFYTAAIDVWGLGAILYEMLGKGGYQPSEAFDCVRQGASPVGPFSFVAEDLLDKMLAVDPKQRLTVDQVLQHPCRSSSSKIYRTWRRPCGAKRSAPGLDKDLVVKKVRAV